MTWYDTMIVVYVSIKSIITEISSMPLVSTILFILLYGLKQNHHVNWVFVMTTSYCLKSLKNREAATIYLL